MVQGPLLRLGFEHLKLRQSCVKTFAGLFVPGVGLQGRLTGIFRKVGVAVLQLQNAYVFDLRVQRHGFCIGPLCLTGLR